MAIVDWFAVRLYILKAIFAEASRSAAVASASKKFGVSESDIEKYIGDKV